MTAVQLPWDERWLNATEYLLMLRCAQAYNEAFGVPILSKHPSSVYTAPVHGLVYYLSRQTLRDLGFPRVKGLHKRFKWKKMNFLTAIPKHKPLVHYVVATARLASVCYRMHIVAEAARGDLLLCQVLKIQTRFKLGVGIPSRQHFRGDRLPASIVEDDSDKEDTVRSPVPRPQSPSKPMSPWASPLSEWHRSPQIVEESWPVTFLSLHQQWPPGRSLPLAETMQISSFDAQYESDSAIEALLEAPKDSSWP